MNNLTIDKYIKKKAGRQKNADVSARHMLQMLMITLEEEMYAVEKNDRFKIFFGKDATATANLQKLLQMLDRLSPAPTTSRTRKKSAATEESTLSREEITLLAEWVNMGE